MNNFYVYGHFRPGEDTPFYIGKGVGKRAWNKSGRNEYWKNVANKYGYKVKLIKENLTEKDAYEWETKLIAEVGLDNLTNIYEGGEGVSSEIAKKRAQDPEWRKMMSNVWENRSEEHKNNIKTAMQKLYIDPEFRKKRLDANKKLHKNPEYRKKLKEITQTDVWREKQKEGIKKMQQMKRDEWRKNISNAMKKKSQDPKHRKTMENLRNDSEYRKKISEGLKRYWANKKKEKTS